MSIRDKLLAFFFVLITLNAMSILYPVWLMLPRSVFKVDLGPHQQFLFDPSHLANSLKIELDNREVIATIVSQDPVVRYESRTVNDSVSVGKVGSRIFSVVSQNIGVINFAADMNLTMNLESDIAHVPAYLNVIPRSSLKRKEPALRLEVTVGKPFELAGLKGVYEVTFERYSTGLTNISFSMNYDAVQYQPVKGSVVCVARLGGEEKCKWHGIKDGKAILISKNLQSRFDFVGREKYPWQLRYDIFEILLVAISFYVVAASSAVGRLAVGHRNKLNRSAEKMYGQDISLFFIPIKIFRMLQSPNAVAPSAKIDLSTRRPGYGKSGKRIMVSTNHFKFQTLPSVTLYRYQLIFEHQLAFRLRKYIWSVLKQSADLNALSDTIVYDPHTSMIISKSNLDHFCGSLNVTLNQIILKVVFAAIGPIDISKTFKSLGAAAPVDSVIVDESVKTLDILLRQQPSEKMVAVGQSFFSQVNSKPLGFGAECWLGMHQSLYMANGQLLLNLDTSATTFIEPLNLVDFTCEMLGRSKEQLKQRGLSETDRIRLEGRLSKLRFAINHRGDYKKRYKICKLSDSANAYETLFKESDQDKSEISVFDYFYSKYHIHLLFPELPCVTVRTTSNKELYFPFEVCDIVPGQKYSHKLSEAQTSNMIELTCQNPAKRQKEVLKCLKLVQPNTKNSLLREFGIGIDSEMMNVPARVLPAPVLSFSHTSKEPQFVPKDGSWNLKSKKIAVAASLKAWSIVIVGSPKDYPEKTIRSFVESLVTISKELGIQMKTPSPELFYANNKTSDLRYCMEQAWKHAGRSTGQQPQLLLFVLPPSGSSVYGNIKRFCDQYLGVVSQCVQGKKIFNIKKQYCINLALKINVKLGGINSFLSSSQLSYLSDVPTIVFGCHILHPNHSEAGKTSIASIVASLDPKLSNFAVATRIQSSRKRMIEDAETMFQELLCKFYAVSSMKPAKILVYRDAESATGESSQDFQQEVEALMRACHSLEPEYNPLITFCLVQRRHHTRFFGSGGASSEPENVHPGTVVEEQILNESQFTFYLCSHSGLQGTSRPACYHVLHDDYGFTADELQQLTFNICFTYARSTRSVSVPPPTYYAHLVAVRARFHLDQKTMQNAFAGNRESSESPPVVPLLSRPPLTDTMFFL